MNKYNFCLWWCPCPSCSFCLCPQTRDRTLDLTVSTFCFVALGCWLQLWISILLQFCSNPPTLFAKLLAFPSNVFFVLLIRIRIRSVAFLCWVLRVSALAIQFGEPDSCACVLSFIVKRVCCLILLKLFRFAVAICLWLHVWLNSELLLLSLIYLS